jgi:hypothetical protein
MKACAILVIVVVTTTIVVMIVVILVVRVGIAVFLLATRWRARLGIPPLRREVRAALFAHPLAATGGYASPSQAVVVRPAASIGAKGAGTSPRGQPPPALDTPSRTRVWSVGPWQPVVTRGSVTDVTTVRLNSSLHNVNELVQALRDEDVRDITKRVRAYRIGSAS